MTPVFADTFFFLALLNAQDHAHTKARAANLVNRPVVTSGWVLIESPGNVAKAVHGAKIGTLISVD